MSTEFPLRRVLVPAASYGECQLPKPLWQIILNFIATKCTQYGLNGSDITIQASPLNRISYLTLSEDLEEIDIFELNDDNLAFLARTGIDAARELLRSSSETDSFMGEQTSYRGVTK